MALRKLNIIKTPGGFAALAMASRNLFAGVYTVVMYSLSRKFGDITLQAVMVDIDSQPMVDVWTPGV